MLKTRTGKKRKRSFCVESVVVLSLGLLFNHNHGRRRAKKAISGTINFSFLVSLVGELLFNIYFQSFE